MGHKILVVNPYGIGDCLFTTPVIRNLRLEFPQASIGYLANARTAAFLKGQPGIDRIFIYDRDEFVAAGQRNPFAFAGKWLALFNDIRKEAFDVVLDYSLNSTFGFLSVACGIPKRIGFDHRGRGRYLNYKVPLTGFEEKHVVDYFLEFLKFINVPVKDCHLSLEVPAADIQWARDWIRERDIDSRKPLVAVFPGGGASWGHAAHYRLWGAEKYAQLTDKIIENYDAAVILMGDSKDSVLCREVCSRAAFPLYNAVGQTSLLGLAALFKQCRGAVINDAGAVHVAVASGIKTLSIYGPVDPDVYGPYPPAEHIKAQKALPCQPCYRRFRMPMCSHISCLRELTVNEVYREVQKIL
jgi:lipopolysaccharide heptosyltransferase II